MTIQCGTVSRSSIAAYDVSTMRRYIYIYILTCTVYIYILSPVALIYKIPLCININATYIKCSPMCIYISTSQAACRRMKT